MPADFDLIITTDTPNVRAEFVLRDQHGVQLAYHLTEFKGIDVSQQRGLFDLRNLAKPGGGSDHLSGEDLRRFFTESGGFLPRLFFLSACPSGDILRVKDWNDCAAIAAGNLPQTKEATPTRDIPFRRAWFAVKLPGIEELFS